MTPTDPALPCLSPVLNDAADDASDTLPLGLVWSSSDEAPPLTLDAAADYLDDLQQIFGSDADADEDSFGLYHGNDASTPEVSFFSHTAAENEPVVNFSSATGNFGIPHLFGGSETRSFESQSVVQSARKFTIPCIPTGSVPVAATQNPSTVLEKKEYRRKVAIPRYLKKRSRRRWTREIMHQSRSVAAFKRPRKTGKFHRTTPQFVPVSVLTADTT